MTKSVSGLILSLVDPFSCFPCLFNFSSLKAGTISCFILLSSNWDFHFPQISRILKIDKLSSLLNLIQNLHLSPSRSDSCLRTLSASGLFSVSSFFSAISAPPSSIRFPQNDLDSSCPFQSLCVSWGNCLEPSPTLDVLQSFNPHRYPRSECFISLPLCCGNLEYLFIHCQFFWRLWGWIFQMANVSCVSHGRPLTLSPYGNRCLHARHWGSHGLFVFIHSFGLYGKNGTNVSSETSHGTFLQFLFDIASWAKSDHFFSFCPLSLFVVTLRQFSFLMRTTSNFLNRWNFLLISKIK